MSSIGWHHFSPKAWMIPGGNSARRRELYANKALPTLSEIEVRLGAPLAHIFLQSMTDTTARDQIGLAPPLKGPKEELWVSPSDILQGRSVLTEPQSVHCRQALTHQSILNIGAAYENAIEVETQKKVKATIQEADKKIRKQKEEELDIAIQKTKTNEQERHQNLLKMYQKQADDFIQKSILKVRETLIEEANAQKEQALRLLRIDMEKQMLVAIHEKEQYIAKKYDFQLSWEINKCYESYQDKIIQQQKKWAGIFEAAKSVFQKELDNIRIELEAKHMIDIIRIHEETQLQINRKNDEIIKNIENSKKINVKNVEEKEAIIAQKIIELKEKDYKLQLLKERLNDLAVQFQKFIKFVLQQRPGQGEYLLSLEEIIRDQTEEEIFNSKEENLLNMSPECNPEIVHLVMALIIETLLKRSDPKSMEEETVAEILKNDYFMEETFEERVEREREVNRAVDLVSTTDQEAKNECYLEEKLAAIKEILTKNPSVMKLFLVTGTTSIQRRLRSFQTPIRSS